MNLPCPACGGQSTRWAWRLDLAPFWRCAECHCLFHGSPPAESEWAEYYNSGYHEARGHGNAEIGIVTVKRRSFRTFLGALPAPAPGARLLEVGCSTGEALQLASELGYAVVGVDRSREAIALARAQHPALDFREGFVEAVVPAPEQFAVIAMFDMIEHVADPHALADALVARLQDNGRIVVATPNAASVSARLLGAKWFHAMAEHVVMHSPQSLDRLFVTRGLRRERLRFAWKWVNLEMLRRHALAHPHVAGARLLSGLLGVLPVSWRTASFPFNIGEMLAVYVKPGAVRG